MAELDFYLTENKYLNQNPNFHRISNFFIFMTDHYVRIYKFNYAKFQRIWQVYADVNSIRFKRTYIDQSKFYNHYTIGVLHCKVKNRDITYFMYFFKDLKVKKVNYYVPIHLFLIYVNNSILCAGKTHLYYVNDFVKKIYLPNIKYISIDWYHKNQLFLYSKGKVYLFNLSNSYLKLIKRPENFVKQNFFFDKISQEYLVHDKYGDMTKLKFDNFETSKLIHAKSTKITKIIICQSRIIIGFITTEQKIDKLALVKSIFTQEKYIYSTQKKYWFKSDKSLTRYMPLMSTHSGDFTFLGQSKFSDDKSGHNTMNTMILIRKNSKHYISFSQGDEWSKLSDIQNSYNSILKYYYLYSYAMIQIPIKNYFKAYFSFDNFHHVNNLYQGVMAHYNIMVNNDMALVLMYTTTNAVVSFDGCRSWNILKNYSPNYIHYFYFEEPFYAYYKSGNLIISQINKIDLTTRHIHLKNINKCRQNSISTITNCDYGYTYTYSVNLDKNIYDYEYCYLTKYQLVAQRNITCQCLNTDYSCAHGYVIQEKTKLCYLPNNRNRKRIVCLNGKNVRLDPMGYEEVYDSNYYSSFCMANLFNFVSDNMTCHELDIHFNKNKHIFSKMAFSSFKRLPEVIGALEITNTETLLGKLNDSTFIFFLNCFDDILSNAAILFDVLQMKKLNMKFGSSKIKKFVEALRTNEHFEGIIERTNNILNSNDIDYHVTLLRRQINYKAKFFEIVDNVLVTLRERFAFMEEYNFFELIDITKFNEFSILFPAHHISALNSIYHDIFDISSLTSK
ncbi:hypothetical protein A3Q56_07583 [Intoshia linei]|uniref:Uncharacterized protein n=1 Tax=Intoshia linei TaxID=1819745 RepID=A0A177AT57_9BILA|nr:hypothetical protein A3Q56_07583 [Intoshia linei]